ncbi:hypothetical protein PV797_13390 [Clostridiaceae bacterium M8S5]|nr:hypothetical protein PV797_13390 [Clostridiaceae bacterium M8S5]
MITNIDTLIATLDILDYDNAFKGLIMDLSIKKMEAKSLVKNNSFETVTTKIANMEFEVYPNGSRHHAFILHNDCYEVKIANFRSKSLDTYPVHIKIKSACLWEKGYIKAWEDICEIISTQGQITANKVSRVDLCCHTDKFKFTTGDIEKFVGKYRSDAIYRSDRALSGFVFGTGKSQTIMARIYNKSLEIKQKNNKLWFRDIWNKFNMDIENVWNVEFELCRKFFKQCGFETVEHVFDNLKSLWHYCTNEWLRFTEGDTTRNTRSNLDHVWSELQKAFSKTRTNGLIRKYKRMSRDAEKLVPSVIGYVTSYCSKKNFNRNDSKKLDIVDCIEDIVSRGLDYLCKVKRKTFDEEVNRKSALLTA